MSKKQSIASVHSWFGLIIGWLLFCIFLTGTLTYFRFEITERMRGVANEPLSQTTALKSIQKKLQQVAPNAKRWMFDLPTKRDPNAHLFIWHKIGNTPSFQKEALNINTLKFIKKERTSGGDFFHHFHYDLNLPNPWGRRLVGFAAAIMLVSLISGIIIHRRIFKDFFTFRPQKGQRSWLDAHNVFGVIALPFHLMVTYTGLIMLIMLYMPWGVKVLYKANTAPFFNEVFLATPNPEPTKEKAKLIDTSTLILKAQSIWGNGKIGRVNIFHPNTKNSIIEFTPSDTTRISSHSQKIIFYGSTGQLKNSINKDQNLSNTRGIMYSLHQAHFATPLIRALYFISGIIGTAMIATGLLLWTVKHKNKLKKTSPLPISLQMVETLNMGTILGLPLAIAVYFWVNKIIPIHLQNKATLEVNVFFFTWLITYFYPLFRKKQKAWRDLLIGNSILYMLIPLLHIYTSEINFTSALQNNQWEHIQLDIFLFLIGLLFMISAINLKKPNTSNKSHQHYETS